MEECRGNTRGLITFVEPNKYVKGWQRNLTAVAQTKKKTSTAHNLGVHASRRGLTWGFGSEDSQSRPWRNLPSRICSKAPKLPSVISVWFRRYLMKVRLRVNILWFGEQWERPSDMLLNGTRKNPPPKSVPGAHCWLVPLPSSVCHANSKYKPTGQPYRWGDNWSWGVTCSEWWEVQRLCLPAGKGLWCCVRGLRNSRMLLWCPDGKAWTGRQSKKTVWNSVVRGTSVCLPCGLLEACQHWG